MSSYNFMLSWIKNGQHLKGFIDSAWFAKIVREVSKTSYALVGGKCDE